MTHAPIVVLAFRRPGHLRRMLTTLMACDGFARSPVIVYCDGPRNESDVCACAETRELARAMLGGTAEYYFSDVNLGVDRSVIQGVTEVVNRFGCAIVVEDDLELSTGFLTYMNQALGRYALDEKVFQISGHMFDVPQLKDTTSALFLPFTTSWGWATWKRAWVEFDPKATGWEILLTERSLSRKFNLDGTYDYRTMLVRTMKETSHQPWDIRWYWTVFRASGLVLYPPVSLVSNTGFDGSGTHGRGFFRRFSENTSTFSGGNIDLPMTVGVNSGEFAMVKMALRKQNGGVIGSIVDLLKSFNSRFL